VSKPALKQSFHIGGCDHRFLCGSGRYAWERKQSSLPCADSQTIVLRKGLRLRQLRDYSVPAFDASEYVFLKVLSVKSFLSVSKSAGDAGSPFRVGLRWPLALR